MELEVRVHRERNFVSRAVNGWQAYRQMARPTDERTFRRDWLDISIELEPRKRVHTEEEGYLRTQSSIRKPVNNVCFKH